MHNVLGGGVEDVNGGREVNTLCGRPVHGEPKSCTELAQEVERTAERRTAVVSAAATGASLVMVAMSAGPETEGTGVVVVAWQTVWTRVGTVSVSISMSAPSVAPRAPEGTGTLVVVMTVAMEVVRPRVRTMAVLSLATLAAEGSWSMVTGTSMALVLAFSVAVAAVVVGRVRVRCRGFDVLLRGGGNGVGIGELTDCLGCFGALWEFLRGVVVTVVTIGPCVRAMSMLSLATFDMEWAWTMVAGASTTPALALTMSAVVAAMVVVVWGVGVRC